MSDEAGAPIGEAFDGDGKVLAKMLRLLADIADRDGPGLFTVHIDQVRRRYVPTETDVQINVKLQPEDARDLIKAVTS